MFTETQVRLFAVQVLRKSNDDEILMYLLQLIQACKYETDSSCLISFILQRAQQNRALGNYLHWHLNVEIEEIRKDSLFNQMYSSISSRLGSDGDIPRQIFLINSLKSIFKELSILPTHAKKVEGLQSFLSNPLNKLISFSPLALPLDANVFVTGIISEKAYVFKSSVSPLKLVFSCLDGSEYPLIFKSGDDLRQDQLVIQLITLMDKLLLKENLDLKLTPYKVLATGIGHGMVQFVDATALASILSENKDLLAFLKQDGIVSDQVMDTYIKSCGIFFLL